jgi:hypothetical protein
VNLSISSGLASRLAADNAAAVRHDAELLERMQGSDLRDLLRTIAGLMAVNLRIERAARELNKIRQHHPLLDTNMVRASRQLCVDLLRTRAPYLRFAGVADVIVEGLDSDDFFRRAAKRVADEWRDGK